jgi:hypothetical protein
LEAIDIEDLAKILLEARKTKLIEVWNLIWNKNTLVLEYF